MSFWKLFHSFLNYASRRFFFLSFPFFATNRHRIFACKFTGSVLISQVCMALHTQSKVPLQVRRALHTYFKVSLSWQEKNNLYNKYVVEQLLSFDTSLHLLYSRRTHALTDRYIDSTHWCNERQSNRRVGV